jgi:cyclopropane fatty-acyl-phospholipid synthase-like methyltransferase
LLHPGRVLDIAMGSGRNAVYLAKMGFDVFGVDISAENIENAQALANRFGVSINTKSATWKTAIVSPKMLMTPLSASIISDAPFFRKSRTVLS